MDLKISKSLEEMIEEIADLKNCSYEDAIVYVLENEVKKVLNRLRDVERMVKKISGRVN